MGVRLRRFEKGARTLTPHAIALAAAKAAVDHKAQDVRILDVSQLSIVADYFVIASSDVVVSVRAIVLAIQEQLAAAGVMPRRREGWEDARWVLLDYADVIVHVFLQPEREYYDLERLWGDAPSWRLQEEDGQAPRLAPIDAI